MGRIAQEVRSAFGLRTATLALRRYSRSRFRDTYAVPGGEIDLQARGAMMGGTLSAAKARLRLAVALANGLPVGSAFPVD